MNAYLNPLRALLMLLLIAFVAIDGEAQVKITGEVTHDGQPLDQVVIRIYENGTYLRAIAADRKGRYEANLPYNHKYEFVFSKPFMVKVKILIDTEVSDAISISQNSFEVPFNMVLHYRYKGMDLQPSEKAIGVIRHAGSGQESFQFFPESKTLAEVKRMNATSTEKEKAGAQPILEEVVHVPSASPTPKVAEEEMPEKVEEEPVEVEEPTKKVAEDFAMEQESERQQTLKRATAMKSDNDRRRQEKQLSAEEERGSEEFESIYSAKVQRAESLRTNREAQEEQMNVRVMADSILAARLSIAASNYRIPESAGQNAAKPLKILHREGWFYVEEELTVLEQGERVTYRHTLWDVGPFESSYYYKDENEIDIREYEKARALFND